VPVHLWCCATYQQSKTQPKTGVTVTPLMMHVGTLTNQTSSGNLLLDVAPGAPLGDADLYVD
jgi:hypothetical protein